MKKKGLIFVYTGNGKGKTTAALGLALRAAGHGNKVLIIQFMKGRDYGEFLAVQDNFLNIIIEKSGRDAFVDPVNPEAVDIQLAQNALKLARDSVISSQYDMVILDEINVAVYFNLVKVEDVLELIDMKQPDLYLGLTGRYAAEKILERADLVTEMKEIRHPFNNGIDAEEGFEY